MAVYLPAYCSREDVKSAADELQTADYNVHIDSAIQTAADEINGLCHRRFYNVNETRSWDWPNYAYSYPWRIWFDAAELADVTVNVPVVTTGGHVIPAGAIFWGDPNYPEPPFTYLELDRSQDFSFGAGSTPQRDVAIAGTFGYWNKSRPAGALAAAVTTTTAATVTVTNSAATGVGDILTVDSERMLVSDKAYSATGQAQVSGCDTGLASDNMLEVGDGSDIFAGELLQLDAEVMLAESVTGNFVTVVRAYDGSNLATHSGAEVYAGRLLTVMRGQFGTAAATHSDAAAVSALLIPAAVRELAIAESLNIVAQKTSAWARTLGENTSAVPGAGLPDLRDRVYARYGRGSRQRVI